MAKFRNGRKRLSGLLAVAKKDKTSQIPNPISTAMY
jgi:hypothetical protein